MVHPFRWMGKLIGWLSGYKVVTDLPDVKKVVVVAAPHTSNWDFPIFFSMVFHFNLRGRFIGKHTLFKGPLGWLMRWMGGMPVNRGSEGKADIIDQVVELFNQNDELLLGMAPEGTRSYIDHWKTGFYRIAVGANVPIMMAYLDSKTKTMGISEPFYPTGDMEADIATIQSFYADKEGINPKNKGFI